MPINIESEPALPLAEIARRLPARRAGKRTHVSCLWRWIANGLRGVRLESIQVGGVTCSSMAAVQRFFNELTAQRVNSRRQVAPTADEIARRETVSREVDQALRPASDRVVGSST
jgi:hypothetical protein